MMIRGPPSHESGSDRAAPGPLEYHHAIMMISGPGASAWGCDSESSSRHTPATRSAATVTAAAEAAGRPDSDGGPSGGLSGVWLRVGLVTFN